MGSRRECLDEIRQVLLVELSEAGLAALEQQVIDVVACLALEEFGNEFLNPFQLAGELFELSLFGLFELADDLIEAELDLLVLRLGLGLLVLRHRLRSLGLFPGNLSLLPGLGGVLHSFGGGRVGLGELVTFFIQVI